MSTETANDTSEVRASTLQSPLGRVRPDTAYTVEEAEEDEEIRARVTKKMKPYLTGRGAVSGEGRTPQNDVVVEEIQDVEMGYANDKLAAKVVPQPVGATAAASSRTTFGHKPTSAPKEPSKLRYSYQPEAATPAAPMTPVATPPFATEVKSEGLSNKQPTIAVTRDPKATALALHTTVLPTFTFTIAAISTFPLTPAEKIARNQVNSKAEASLPTYTLSQKPEASSSTDISPIVAFDWSAATAIKPLNAIDGNWTCSTCMLSNPASAMEMCTVCEAPRPATSSPSQKTKETNASMGSVAPTSSNTFDWSTAGIRPPSIGDSWTCSTCMLSNPASATEKCTVCDTPR